MDSILAQLIADDGAIELTDGRILISILI
jgi:hypothetical protein